MQPQLNLTGKSLIELKAYAYDISTTIQSYNQLLKLLNDEIADRMKQEQMQGMRKPGIPLESKEKAPE